LFVDEGTFSTRPRPRASMRWYFHTERCHDPNGLRARAASEISLNRVFLMWPCTGKSDRREVYEGLVGMRETLFTGRGERRAAIRSEGERGGEEWIDRWIVVK